MPAISSIVERCGAVRGWGRRARCAAVRGWGRRARCAAVWLGGVAMFGSVAAQPLAPPDSLAPPAGPHPLCVRDLWTFERVSDPQPSPDGAWIAYVRKSFDVQANKGRSNLWLVPTAGGVARRVTTAKANDSGPRWSPNGRSVAFLSDRSGSTQIWSLDLAGGEPRALTELPVDVQSFRWSPNGIALAFAAEVYPDCATLVCTKERAQKLEGNGILVRRYDHLFVRHWDTWDSGRRQHLFVVPATGGTPVDIVRGAEIDAPSPPFGGAESYDWSPDGTTLVFAARTRNPSASWTTNLDLYLGAADGTGFRCITASNLAVDTAPVFAPDGKSVAYLAMVRPGYEADRERILVYDIASGTRRVVTEAWDRSPGEIVWSPGGKTLYTSVSDEARRQLYAVELAGGGRRKIAHNGSATGVRAFRSAAGERLVFVGESLTAPAEVWTCLADGSHMTRLTESNAAALANVRLSEPREIWCEGAGGTRVHAWLFPPVGRRDGEKYPLVLLVHGGPQGSWDDRFSYRWNPQVYAGAGYAVLAPDPRGSTGYGQAFTDAISGDWGGAPYEDLMLGLDAALAKFPWLDGTRAAALGASYGGFMINWINGHTDRFKALVCHDGNIDERMAYFDTEELWFPEWDHGGVPWDKADGYQKHNPIDHVKNWKTPTLVVHGGLDYRVVDTQGMSTFTALQRKGVPSRFIHFPDENHWVLKPQNSKLWHDEVLAWIDKYTKR